MISELTALFESVGPEASREDYVEAIVEDNVLGKSTTSTRRLSAQRLSELYALDPDVSIFRALRSWWAVNTQDQPLLALLCGLARDPMLRATMPAVLSLRSGDDYNRSAMRDALKKLVGERLNESILDKVARNAGSSWTQSGHLEGRALKKRVLVKPAEPAVAMAVLLGYLQGIRGRGLLLTRWCEVLDSSPETISRLASKASARGLMTFRRADEVIDVGFPRILSNAHSIA